jgi:hypothetical protein
MKLNKLKNKLYDSNYQLDVLLVEFRSIATKTKNNFFLKWIENELKGYTKENTPSYRICKNNGLKVAATNGLTRINGTIAIDSLKVETNNEKEFIEDISNVKVYHSLVEIQDHVHTMTNLTITPEQSFCYILNQQISSAAIHNMNILIKPAQLKNILSNIRLMLQDFIEDLEKINNWENSELTDILIDETFTGSLTINQTTNITNTTGNGNGHIINNGNGNDNKLSIILNDNNDILKECITLVNGINENNQDIERLKLDIITTLKECEKEKINSKPKILEKISAVIVTSTAVAADAATAMPLFTTLLNYLRLQ